MADLQQIVNVLASLDRATVQAAVETMHVLLDMLDDDPDLEPNGDERDNSGAEDEITSSSVNVMYVGAAGCPIGDPGEDEHDREVTNEDGAEEEYRTRPIYGPDQSMGPLNERQAMLLRNRAACTTGRP